MKALFLPLGLLFGLTYGNIILSHPPLSCNWSKPGYTGCMTGQHCTSDGLCVSSKQTTPYPLSFIKRAYSTDGQCGPEHGNLLCDPSSKSYTGSCCSQYGWCGDTIAHCGTGCFSGCSPAKIPPPSAQVDPAPRPDGRCGANFNGATCDANGAFGRCCSSYGYCGNTDAHCLSANGCQNGCNTSPSSSATPVKSGPTASRADGRCGAGFGGATCDPTGQFGGCCSQYGYCGSSAAHCLVSSGCQNSCTGTTLAIPTSTVSGTSSPTGAPATSRATPTGGVSTDGKCGVDNGDKTCGNWPLGSCCSLYGFCGNSTSHCGAGCQSGPCLNGARPAAPGPSPALPNPNPGYFNIVGRSGVPAMHAGLLPNGRVFFLDKVENYTELKLPNNQYAYSSEYDPSSNTVVPLSYKTNAFCCGGIFLADGQAVSLGGNAPLDFIDPTVGDGFDGIRYLKRSPSDASLNGNNWSEPGNKLASKRWYASAQILGDGTIFVASGSLNGLDATQLENNNPTYEVLNPDGTSQGKNFLMDLLVRNQPYFMYPFIHLLNDGSLFVFVSESSVLFNVQTNTQTKRFPDLPGDYRTYPNTGGSILLPLSSGNNWASTVMVCGGGAYQDINAATEPSCGRIDPLDPNAKWEMDSMPEGRVMVEGTLLPDGTIVWLNGCNRGAQGFGLGREPTLEALIYYPTKPRGRRWTTGASSTIPRLYHSVALLLLDGTLLIAGSNPVQQPILIPTAKDPFVTEVRVEIYTPPYLQGANADKRPSNVELSSKSLLANGSGFTIKFNVPEDCREVKVALYYGGFVTHSLHMGHRMLFLDNTGFLPYQPAQEITVRMPPTKNLSPPGPYVVYVVVDGVPAVGQFVMVS